MNSTGSAATEVDCLRGFTLWDIYYSEWRVSIEFKRDDCLWNLILTTNDGPV